MRLELRGITKTFGDLVANQDVDLTVESGEIHALLGENGAGKTTLMNVLFGLYRADSGEILIDGEPVHFSNPKGALAAGIGMVHQHFMLVDVFTVAENIVLGHEPRFGLNLRKTRKEVLETSSELGLHVDPDAIVENLPVGAQQRVEIVKALIGNAELLILDEPTAVLTPQESDELFSVMRKLRGSGKSMLFITHKLGEVLAVADRITVLRLGRVAGNTTPRETTRAALAEMMVGRSVSLTVDKSPAKAADPVLTVTGLAVDDDRGAPAVRELDLDVKAGEIVAIAGVQGNGQTELVEALVGLRRAKAGRVVVDGKDLTGASTHQVLNAGVGHVPEDRRREGLILGFPLAENLMLDMYDHEPFSRHDVIDNGAIRQNAAKRMEEFDIRAGAGTVTVEKLSGGNQQKVILAREFSRPLRLLIASQPTRGLDIGSIETIHRRIVSERDNGTAVVVVSSELDEVMSLGDRIAVMYRGRISGWATPSTSREDIGLMMAGVSADVPPGEGGSIADEGAPTAGAPAGAASSAHGTTGGEPGGARES